MGDKVVISSNSKDSHGDIVSENALVNGVSTINGSEKMRMLIDHRRDLPPIGYWDHAELVYEEDLCLLKAEPISFIKKEILDGDRFLIKESFSSPITFIKRPFDETDSISLTLDKNNFESYEVFESVSRKLISDSSEQVELKHDLRKALLPDPRLIITLTTYYSVVYPIIKPILKKIGEKIADDIGEDIYNFSKKKIKKFTKDIKGYITTTRQKSIPKDKKLVTIFEIPGTPYIELHAKTDDSNLIIKSITPKKIFRIHEKIRELGQLIEISEIHFKLNEKGVWKFTYLIGKDSSVIGTKDIMDKREYLQKRINLNPRKGFSMGADVKYIKEKK